MSQHVKTILLVEAARGILAEYHPMTVRQVYYQLVSGQVIKNNRSEYQAVSNTLVKARQDGIIPWGWIEDRLRLPHEVGMWDDLADFAETAIHAYRRDTWVTQPVYLECWLEKDALSGIFENVLEPFGVILNVGRGYDGWSSLYNAARRFEGTESAMILYYGDLDPSGEDMVRSLRERLGHFGCNPEIIKCALTLEDVKKYNLPPALAKKTDTRRAAYVEKFGDVCVELDALPAAVLQSRLKNDLETRLDLEALELVKQAEQADKERLMDLLGGEA
jgi:hypothetical protein